MEWICLKYSQEHSYTMKKATYYHILLHGPDQNSIVCIYFKHGDIFLA